MTTHDLAQLIDENTTWDDRGTRSGTLGVLELGEETYELTYVKNYITGKIGQIASYGFGKRVATQGNLDEIVTLLEENGGRFVPAR